MAESFDSVMVDSIRQWIGEKIKRENILNQNGANMTYVHGVDIARKVGLPDDMIRGKITPFPATQTVIVGGEKGEKESNEVTPENIGKDKRSSMAKKLLASTAIALVGGSLGVAAMAIANPSKDNNNPNSTTIVMPDNPNGSVGLRIE